MNREEVHKMSEECRQADREFQDEYITLTIRAKASIVPGRRKNFLHLNHWDNIATITDNGEEIGQIGGTFGAGYEIADRKTGYTWFITKEAFWEAYQNRDQT